MNVRTLGDGDPTLAVVACLHGDELCGKRAIDRLLDAEPAVSAPVSLVVANEPAVEAGVRFLEQDLNRAFPGDPDGDTRESRLAAELLTALDGTPVLDLHATVSQADPFALVHDLTPATAELARATGVDHVVDVSYVAGGLISHVPGVAVECGLKGTDEATENAVEILERVLACTDVLDGDCRETDPELFEIVDVVEGGDWEFLGTNFERVEAGESYARRGGERRNAAEPFTPVLMSTDGYEEILGYRARRRGRVSDLVDANGPA
jgi:predicted deacylase